MSDTAQILIVDDEPQICALVQRYLASKGYRVRTAETGEVMRRSLRNAEFDLVILDLGLPGDDGLALLRELREKSEIPVIILTAMGEPSDRVIGLELGADDYIAKPFEPRELLARVRSVLRRSRKAIGRDDLPAVPGLRFGRWKLDFLSRHLISPKGEEVSLTTAQFELLAVLATHPNRVLSRSQLFDLARHRSGTPCDRTIDIHIGHLRRKIEEDPRHPSIIKTVHGAGYVFTARVERMTNNGSADLR
jgi:two-component system, OmpR family, response regulator